MIIIIISVQQLLFPLPSFTFLISIFLFFSFKRQKFRDIGCKKCAFLALCKKKKMTAISVRFEQLC